MDFLKSHPEMRLHETYEDDGYTGVNFERPNFLCLAENIKRESATVLWRKNFQDSAETGRYIQNIFPCPEMSK